MHRRRSGAMKCPRQSDNPQASSTIQRLPLPLLKIFRERSSCLNSSLHDFKSFFWGHVLSQWQLGLHPWHQQQPRMRELKIMTRYTLVWEWRAADTDTATMGTPGCKGGPGGLLLTHWTERQRLWEFTAQVCTEFRKGSPWSKPLISGVLSLFARRAYKILNVASNWLVMSTLRH